MKKYLLGLITGLIICGGIGLVIAVTYNANDIGYTPKDTAWKKSNGEDITNVKDAIDELYINKNSIKISDVVKSGNGIGTSFTINELNYQYYVLSVSQWSNGCYDSICSVWPHYFEKPTVSNATYVEIGNSCRSRNSQCGFHKVYLIIPDGTNQNITINFDSAVDNYTLNGIK